MVSVWCHEETGCEDDSKWAVGCYASSPSKKKWCATELTRLGKFTSWDYCKMDMDTCTFGKDQD